jgi:non-haem Fe2+, alpha-ketoglutarate-dependent halogenase
VEGDYRPCPYHQKQDDHDEVPEAAVRQYRELGYCARVAALTRAEAADLHSRLEDFEATGGTMQGAVRHKPHLLFTWLNDLIRHPRILDAVEAIIGPDILCWGSS